jgi:hypothetical protein
LREYEVVASHAQAVSQVSSQDVVEQREPAPEERQVFEVPLLLPLCLKMEDF